MLGDSGTRSLGNGVAPSRGATHPPLVGAAARAHNRDMAPDARHTWRPATQIVHASSARSDNGSPLLPGPVFAGTYRHRGDPEGDPYTYGRYTNPTWNAYESALAELEGGPALLFASGVAAATAVLCTTLRDGDIAVLPADGYYTVRTFAQDVVARLGVDIRVAPTRADGQLPVPPGCRLLWIETPTNPGLDVCDIRRLADAAHEVGALVAVDNTTATPLGQRPLELGADFSVSSDTKAMTGHADLLLGHVAARDETLLRPLAGWRSMTGAIAGPMETWLAHRSLATLDVRLQRQCATALRIAEALRDEPAVGECRYPGLPGDPSYPVARRQMTLFGPVIGFTLADGAHADRFIDSLKIVTPATSFGGVHSVAERRARWGGDEVHPGFVRLSVGVEDPADLLDDILGAIPR